MTVTRVSFQITRVSSQIHTTAIVLAAFLFSAATTHVACFVPLLRFPSGAARQRTGIHSCNPLNMEWVDLEPTFFDKPDLPRMFKDDLYRNSVLEAWATETAAASLPVQYSPIAYQSHDDNTPLSGYLVRRKPMAGGSGTGPAVVLFHTAAGPHDIFLLWKAASILKHMNGTVMICDILSDSSGWGWDADRSRYLQARAIIDKTAEDNFPTRPALQSRIQAAYDLLENISKCEQVYALGWCLGGHAILELGRMDLPKMTAMATFHGVFDGIAAPKKRGSAVRHTTKKPCQVHIFSGQEDPFVNAEMIAACKETLEFHGCLVQTKNFPGAKHGFTNPAQDHNPNPSFGYQHQAAAEAWEATLTILSGESTT